MKAVNEKREKYLEEYKTHGNKGALDKLVLSYLPNVEKIIVKYEDRGIEHDELVSIGIEAVVYCITRINFKSINKLSSLISNYINRYIIVELEKIHPENISYEKYASVHKNGEDNFYTDEGIKNIINQATIDEILCLLTDRQKEILILKYGLFDNEVLNKTQISRQYGISHQAVDIYEKRIYEKIRRKQYITIKN